MRFSTMFLFPRWFLVPRELFKIHWSASIRLSNFDENMIYLWITLNWSSCAWLSIFDIGICNDRCAIRWNIETFSESNKWFIRREAEISQGFHWDIFTEIVRITVLDLSSLREIFSGVASYQLPEQLCLYQLHFYHYYLRIWVLYFWQ